MLVAVGHFDMFVLLPNAVRGNGTVLCTVLLLACLPCRDEDGQICGVARHSGLEPQRLKHTVPGIVIFRPGLH